MSDVPAIPSLHSRYDPEKEAKRYVDAHLFTFMPMFVFVTEPGNSWLAPVLRARFPKAVLVALRYQDLFFNDSDAAWDSVWRPGSGLELSRFLFDLLPDEYLPLAVFLPWKPSDPVWPDRSLEVWEAIASMIRLQQSVMHTRSHFGRRWLSNMIRNSLYVRTAIFPAHTSKPVLLACAGPTLERQLPLSGDAFYVCAVSSALSCLRSHACIPDLCIATDGGYWALDHFRGIEEDVPVAFPLEAAVPPFVLAKNPAVLLSYGSPLEKQLFDLAGIMPEHAERNGTVSGTAAMYALSHTTDSVFAAGLDLTGTASFAHARPHASEANLDAGTDRLHPASGQLYVRNLDTGSLAHYASWFSSRDTVFRSRFFRLAPEGKPLTGIEIRNIGDVPRANGCVRAITVRQEIPGPSVRRKRIRRWLATVSGSLAVFTDAKGFTFDSFSQAILTDPVIMELFQMISYTDHLQLLKKKSMPDQEGFADAAAVLCRKTVAFLSRLDVMAAAGE